MFVDPARFAFTRSLEQNWRRILLEYEAVASQTVEWPERHLYDEGWKVFGLFDFPHGREIAGGIARCPVTARLVAEAIPSHGAAGFSVMHPGTRIRPHRGYAGDFLRCHLALKVPGPDCGLTVAGETRRWREGEAMVFDDRVEHSAWNAEAGERVILLVDFVP